MNIYDLLANNYSEIFPVESDKVHFIKEYCSTSNARILDIGCATGDLAIELSKLGHNAVGIDLNSKMIEIAGRKVEKEQSPIQFQILNMLDVGSLGNFECVLCLGNTLPHLSSEDDVYKTIVSISSIVTDGGVFIFQILNYDKILNEQKVDFKVIETDSIIFKRQYYFKNDMSISFRIDLEDKKTKQKYTGTTELLPLRKRQLFLLLERAGFDDVHVFSDYNRTESNFTEFSLIYVAEKRKKSK